MKNQFKKRVVCITGSSGNLGRYFCKQYSKIYTIRKYPHRIENINRFKQWIKKNNSINYFIHFAGISGKNYLNNKKCLKINYLSTINILNVLKSFKLKKFKYFLYISTSHVYKFSDKKISENFLRTPNTIYGISKKKTEDFILQKKKSFYFRIGIARIFNFTSEYQNRNYLIPDLTDFIKKNEHKKVLNLNNFNKFRDFIHIKEICKSLDLMIKKNFSGPLNIASGKKINIISLIKIILKIKKVKKKFLISNKPKQNLTANINKLIKLGIIPKKNIKNYIKDYI